MRSNLLGMCSAVAAVAVAGAASANVTVNFATAPNPATYSTSLFGPGTSSSWLANGWSAGQGAWQLSAPAVAGPAATFNMAAASFVPAGTTLSNTYATGTFRYSDTSNIPAIGQALSPVFVFSVSRASANDTQISVGNIVAGGASPFWALERNPYDWGNALRSRESVGFRLGWAAPGIIVNVGGNRTGLASGAFDGTNSSDTWSQLMATSTGSGGTFGDLQITGVSIYLQGVNGTFDPATIGNNTQVLIQSFTVPAPGAIALLGAAGLIARRRKA